MKNSTAATTNTKKASLLSQLYLLSKPGIVYGNLLAGAAGYFLAVSEFSWSFIALIIGLGLVLASAGYANNIMDLRIDRVMKRTEKRPLVTGAVPLWAAYLGALIGITGGLALLYVTSNPLTVILAFLGWAGYLFVYGWAKRHTHHSTFIGSFPGAMPPLIGYTFITNQIDTVGWILYAMMFVWQMPHFYGISLFRKDDYRAAGVPILSIVKGNIRVLREMRFYVFLYTLLCLAMVLVGNLQVLAALALLVSALWWTGAVASEIDNGNEIGWARRVFGKSLIVLLLWPIIFALNLFVK